MKQSDGRKGATRKAILDSAAALFRRDGYHATGIDQVMAGCGLTAGGFYSHFRSKTELLAEVINHISGGPNLVSVVNDTGLSGREWVKEFTKLYLAEEHRETPAKGCPLPSLSPEIGRSDTFVRETTAALVEEMKKSILKHCDRDENTPLALLALLVGAQALSRATSGHEISDEILSAARHAASKMVTESKAK